MRLHVTFGNPKLNVCYGNLKLNVTTGLPIVKEYTDERPHYQGVYTVVPKKDEQTVLATANKVMDDDVTVLEIPYQAVSNLVGGTTAIIGGI